MSSLVRTELNGVVSLVLSRPAQRNALSFDLLSRLRDELKELELDGCKRYRAVMIKGCAESPKVFCSGHDLGEMMKMNENKKEELFKLCSDVMISINSIPQPTIAVVRGLATAAGCQLVASCDLAVTSRQSGKFATPGVNIGLFCSTPSVALGRAIGRKAAMEMLLTGRAVSADEALRLGLVSHVVEKDSELDEFSLNLAEKIAAHSGSALAIGKKQFYSHMATGDISKAYEIASNAMATNMKTHDANEGIRAFLEKRSPKWNHN